MTKPCGEMDWDINLRANLRLWPDPSPNIRALSSCLGETYDETAFLNRFGGTTDTRAVRQTFEVMAYAGLVYRSADGNDRLLPTRLGECCLSFLGLLGSRRWANPNNRTLLVPFLVRALSLNQEIWAVWKLMRLCDDRLTNEVGRIRTIDDVDPTAAAILTARTVGDVEGIGARRYDPDGFASRPSDQRKAINPLFLLAGGGGWFIDVGTGDESRWLLPVAQASVEDALRHPFKLQHASTRAADVMRLASHSNAPTLGTYR